MKKILNYLLNLLLVPIFATHRHIVGMKRPQARVEALHILLLINADSGCSEKDARKKYQRLVHLCEHYGISYAELDIADEHELQNRISYSIARANTRNEAARKEFLQRLNPTAPPQLATAATPKTIRIC